MDDHAGIRKVICQLLGASGDTLLECVSGREAVKAARDFKPDCVTMDIRMPDLCGLEAARAIRAIHPPSRIVIVTSYDLPFLRQTAEKIGAIGYVLKDNLAELRAVLAGGVVSPAESNSTVEPESEPAPMGDRSHPASPDCSPTAPYEASTKGGQGPMPGEADARLRVLMVEDDGNDCELIRLRLVRCGFKPVVKRVQSRSEMHEALQSDCWDIVFTDCQLPRFSGTEALVLIREIGLHLPVICVTGSEEPAKISGILNAGAVDVINKDDLTPLCAAVTRALSRRGTQPDQRVRPETCDAVVDHDGQVADAANRHPTGTSTEQDVCGREAQLDPEKLELSTFVDTVAHELSDPLLAIHTATTELQSNHSASLPLDGQKCLQKINANCRRLDARFDRLLALARSEQGHLKWELVNSATLVKEAIAETLPEPVRHRIIFKTENLPDVRGDRALLRFVFVNLLANSLEFSAEREQPVIQIDCSLIGGKVLFSINHNGTGFDMRTAEGLFRPLHGLHPDSDYVGSGLSLGAVRRIICRHGGHIWAEATLNRGAAFHFTLPCASTASSKAI